jgi:hypothetical protein
VLLPNTFRGYPGFDGEVAETQLRVVLIRHVKGSNNQMQMNQVLLRPGISLLVLKSLPF